MAVLKSIMGTAYYIVLENKIDGLDTRMDGKRLARQLESLDAVARDLGVSPLTDFVSLDPDSMADLLGDDADAIPMSPVRQFSAEDGLASVRALLLRPEAQAALHDLKDCERILTAAVQQGVGWHFQIDI